MTFFIYSNSSSIEGELEVDNLKCWAKRAITSLAFLILNISINFWTYESWVNKFYSTFYPLWSSLLEFFLLILTPSSQIQSLTKVLFFWSLSYFYLQLTCHPHILTNTLHFFSLHFLCIHNIHKHFIQTLLSPCGHQSIYTNTLITILDHRLI